MNKPIIAIDVDDVLANNAKGFTAFSNERWGTNLQPDEYDEHWGKLWKLEHDLEETTKRRDHFISSRIHREYEPINGAYEALLRLSDRFELRVATSRLSVMRDDTAEWLHTHYKGVFSDETIHLAGIWDTIEKDTHTATKAELVKFIGADYLIDDQLKHCAGAAAVGVTSLLFGNYRWNQTDHLPKDVIRVSDWQAVEAYFMNEVNHD